MITRDGKVAIKYYPPAPHILKINGKVYNFTVRLSVSMAWIDEADVPQVMAITKTCCGGSKHNVFRYANELDEHRWTTGKER